MSKRNRRLSAVKHNRHKVDRHLEKYQNKEGARDSTRTVSVKVEIKRNSASIGSGGGFKNQFIALACPVGKGKHMPTNWAYYKKHGHFPRGRMCGDGAGPSPTKAFQGALKSLARIKR